MAPEPESFGLRVVYVILAGWILLCTFLLGYFGAFPTIRLFHP